MLRRERDEAREQLQSARRELAALRARLPQASAPAPAAPAPAVAAGVSDQDPACIYISCGVTCPPPPPPRGKGKGKGKGKGQEGEAEGVAGPPAPRASWDGGHGGELTLTPTQFRGATGAPPACPTYI